MPLPHFTQLQVAGAPGGPGTNPQEPVYLNLFEVTFVLPTILQAQGRDPILFLQQALSIDLNTTNKTLGVSNQRWKYSTRAFINAGPSETHIEDLAVSFNVNVNNNGSMETWAALRAWYDLAWNSRRVTFQNCQLKAVSSPSLTYEGQGILANVTANFVCDYWVDEYIDGSFTIAPPFVAGY